MYSNLALKLKYFTSLLLATFLLTGNPLTLLAEERTEAYLRIKPSQCVSLRQGQDCFVKLNIDWQALEQGDYCLFSEQQSKAIYCWTNSLKGQIETEMKINGDTQFWLKTQNSEQVIAKTLLKQAWVHKKQRLSFSSWRIFK